MRVDIAGNKAIVMRHFGRASVEGEPSAIAVLERTSVVALKADRQGQQRTTVKLCAQPVPRNVTSRLFAPWKHTDHSHKISSSVTAQTLKALARVGP